jgi:hypothetical protein
MKKGSNANGLVGNADGARTRDPSMRGGGATTALCVMSSMTCLAGVVKQGNAGLKRK